MDQTRGNETRCAARSVQVPRNGTTDSPKSSLSLGPFRVRGAFGRDTCCCDSWFFEDFALGLHKRSRGALKGSRTNGGAEEWIKGVKRKKFHLTDNADFPRNVFKDIFNNVTRLIRSDVE